MKARRGLRGGGGELSRRLRVRGDSYSKESPNAEMQMLNLTFRTSAGAFLVNYLDARWRIKAFVASVRRSSARFQPPNRVLGVWGATDQQTEPGRPSSRRVTKTAQQRDSERKAH